MTPLARAPIDRILSARSRVWHLGVVLCGSGAMALASWIEAPMYPVPMTLQSLMVCLLAGLAGPVLSLEMIGLWLAFAALGLPVLADGGFGLAALTGPTAGYLAGFVVAGGVCGWLIESPDGRKTSALVSSFLLAHLIILTLGFFWLSLKIGPQDAFSGGVSPFLWGAGLKSILATACVKLVLDRLTPERPTR